MTQPTGHRASHTCLGADAVAVQLHRVDGSLATNYRAIFSSVGGGSPANKVLALSVVITTVMRYSDEVLTGGGWPANKELYGQEAPSVTAIYETAADLVQQVRRPRYVY
jgi:hypothetical protein